MGGTDRAFHVSPLSIGVGIGIAIGIDPPLLVESDTDAAPYFPFKFHISITKI